VQARAVGRGFGRCARRGSLTVRAGSILPEHGHLVLARHTCRVERIVNLLKGATTQALLEEGLHPFGDHRTATGTAPGCRN
jgi:hypothetical protein